VIGRLRPGVSPARAEADLSEIARDLERRFPRENERLGARLRPLIEGMIVPRERDRYLGYGRTLSFAALLLLVVASANLANLLLARGLERGRELSIRHAVGGGLGPLTRLLVIESLLLFLLGGLLSVPVGAWCLRLLWSFRPPELEAGDLDLRLDPAIFGGTLLFTLGAMLLFGVLPALRLARLNLAASLREARAPEAAPGLWHPRRLLVAGQLALTLFALIGANLLLESLMRARRADLGFQPEPLLVLTVSPGDQGYGEAGARDYYRRLLETVSALPGVRSASLSENRLLRGAVLQRAIYPEGRSEGLEANGRSSHRVNSVTPGFFRTAGIPLPRGRDFSGVDCAACKRVAIVNQTLARLAWPGQDPVGRRFRFDDPGEPPVEVVGIARDAKYRYVHEDPQPFVYLPLSQSFAPSMTLHVRAGSRPEALLPAVRRAAQAADPGMPLADVDTMAHQVTGALWMERASTLLLSLFGLLALLLSGIGIYSVMGLSVTRRQREIAIRLALGSGHRQVVARVMAEAAALAMAGLLTGGTAAWFFLGPVVASQLGGAGARSPGAYAAQSLVLLATAVGASLPAAWRAARISPMLPLREG
jgi:predicted permease